MAGTTACLIKGIPDPRAFPNKVFCMKIATQKLLRWLLPISRFIFAAHSLAGNRIHLPFRSGTPPRSSTRRRAVHGSSSTANADTASADNLRISSLHTHGSLRPISTSYTMKLLLAINFFTAAVLSIPIPAPTAGDVLGSDRDPFAPRPIGDGRPVEPRPVEPRPVTGRPPIERN
ncbi:hypothetical protein EJ04DRAFT_587261 [Polyplosphaeria fusca]|uniref:Uncharacterized protein n=1 Tax=Polyplosphaeria fusca TaxID=682080 RepID=A0A9P4QP30_9PLEO|nr:hypothetical protein EJ04DRAFT_587261 [Polyplosphaeria fusca]